MTKLRSQIAFEARGTWFAREEVSTAPWTRTKAFRGKGCREPWLEAVQCASVLPGDVEISGDIPTYGSTEQWRPSRTVKRPKSRTSSFSHVPRRSQHLEWKRERENVVLCARQAFRARENANRNSSLSRSDIRKCTHSTPNEQILTPFCSHVGSPKHLQHCCLGAIGVLIFIRNNKKPRGMQCRGWSVAI